MNAQTYRHTRRHLDWIPSLRARAGGQGLIGMYLYKYELT
jgi:hypothetical protein